MAEFTHLHVHTEYSLLDGLSNIKKLVARAKKQNQKALAITDHGAMYGVIKFYLEAKKAGIKPIIGVEAYMSEKDHVSKQPRMGADAFHLLLLAKNTKGYKNLMRLTSIAHLNGYSYKPRIDFELLTKHKEGLIATSGCPQGLVSKKLMEGDKKAAKEWAKKFHKLFGKDYYIELQSHPKNGINEQLNPQLVEISKDLGIPLVATNDVHYVDEDDAEAQDALLAVQMRKTVDDANRLSMIDSPDYFLRSSEDMASAFSQYPDAIENTVKIAKQCEVEIPIGKMIFPDYPLPKGETPESALGKMVKRGLPGRYENPTREIKDRIDYELGVINSKGFATYFLIVGDFVNWAKNKGIRVGPGRGSVAGSIVAFLTHITDVDPIKHNIPFERFLNPQRPSPPDIDIDIADERRDEVIRYVAKKYGEDHVAQIITFGTMEARGSIRDVGRALGMPYSEPDRIAKLIPQGFSIEEALVNVFELQEYYKQDKFKKLLDLAKKVEGSARHASTHAAGVVIADKPLIEYTPVQRETKGGKVVSQYDMYSMDLNISEEAIGLLKMDFLGLRNLSTLGRAVELIEERSGEKIDLAKIRLDDEKVFKLLSRGETTGVFQLESAGMRRVARKLRPNRFSDITAMVALYRPGPMELINDFILGKSNPKKIRYPHPDLKGVLEETYGIPVYQEQVLQIANVMAGFSLGEADILRRAIGKKKKSIMDKEKKKFIDGAIKQGYTKEIAKKIWSFIDKFAGYGFNKAHSVSYAMIAYQTAYIKVNYPLEYMAALLTVESGSTSMNKEEKIGHIIEECRRMNIKLLPPDINKSKTAFTIEETGEKKILGAIRFGFSGIKNVGGVAIDNILQVRDKDGDFSSLTDFCSRVDNRKVNKKVLESLIRVGAMDMFGGRSALLVSLDTIRQKASERQSKLASGQAGLFDVVGDKAKKYDKDDLPKMDEMPKRELLLAEKELLGFYLTEHPLADLLESIREEVNQKISDLDENLHLGKSISIGGIITEVKTILTKRNNSEMAFATIEDESGKIEVVVFPKIYADSKALWLADTAVILEGKVDSKEDKLSYLVDSVRSVSVSGTGNQATQVVLKIPRGTSKEVLKQVGKILKNHKGDKQVKLVLPNGMYEKTMILPYLVDYNEKVMKMIKQKLEV